MFTRGGFKRGAAHFEMVISFVFFMSFVVFLFAVLSPFTSSPISDTVLDRLHDSFVHEVSTNYTTFSFNVSGTNPPCFHIDLSTQSIEQDVTNFSSIVTHVDTGSVISSEVLYPFLRINQNPGTAFYSVALSPEFKKNTVSGCSGVSYVPGLVVNDKVLSNDSITNLRVEYIDGDAYKLLKERLKLPIVFEFSLLFEDFPELAMDTKLIPDSAQVYAKDYVAEVLTQDGELTRTKLTVLVW